MTNFNLLPWRERRRLNRNKQFIWALILSFLLTLLATAVAWGILKQTNKNLFVTNQDLRDSHTQLVSVEAANTRLHQQQQQSLAQLTQLDKLTHHRSSLVQLWSELSAAVTSPMYLTKIKQEESIISLTGRTKEANKVSGLKSYLQQTPFLHQPQVKQVSASPSQPMLDYSQRMDSYRLEAGGSNLINDDQNLEYLSFEIVAKLTDFDPEKLTSAQIPAAAKDLTANEVEVRLNKESSP